MGGRKDDVARPQKPNRNRPLSAVLEEFEVDDHDPKGNIIIITNSGNNNNNNNNNDVKENDVNANEEGLDRTKPYDHPEPSGESRTSVTTSGPNSRTLTSSQSCNVTSGSVGGSQTSGGSPNTSTRSMGMIEESPTIHQSGSVTSLEETPRFQGSRSIKDSEYEGPRVHGSGSVRSVEGSPRPHGSGSVWSVEGSPRLQGSGSVQSGEEGGRVQRSGSLKGSEGSPKTARRGSLRSARRQAPTPSSPSPQLTRKGSLGLSAARFASPGDVIGSDDDTLSPTDLARLKQTADRLHLSTRRPSVMQWRAQYVECPQFPAHWNAGKGDVTEQHGGREGGGRWTAERTNRINTALDWIKNELVEMRAQDQVLARQLLTIKSDIYRLKLARASEEHQDMLDDVQSELEELQEFADVLDLPTPTLTDSPLKHLGVTRMNFSARRFSTC